MRPPSRMVFGATPNGAAPSIAGPPPRRRASLEDRTTHRTTGASTGLQLLRHHKHQPQHEGLTISRGRAAGGWCGP